MVRPNNIPETLEFVEGFLGIGLGDDFKNVESDGLRQLSAFSNNDNITDLWAEKKKKLAVK